MQTSNDNTLNKTMNNPSKNGFMKIGMEIVEALMRTRLSGREWQILMALFRKTWGWNKEVDAIPLSQFAVLTGISRSHCADILHRLESRKIIERLDFIVPKNGNRCIRKYKFNMRYYEWLNAPKNRNCSRKRERTAPRNGNKMLPKTGNSIDPGSINTRSINKVSKIFEQDSLPFILAQKLYEAIKINTQEFKMPNFQKWASDIDKLLRIDKIPPDKIEQVILWLPGSWWGQNGVILSASKFRKQFPQLITQSRNQRRLITEPDDITRRGTIL